MSELARRVLFSVVAIPVALGVMYAGGVALAVLLALLAALGAWELFRIAGARGVEPLAGVGIALAASLPLLRWAHDAAGVAVPAVVGALAVLVVLALAIWERGVTGRPLPASAITVLGVLYTGGMLSFGYAIRYHRFVVPTDRRAGTALLLLPLLLTWATDTGAYAVGRAIGRRKLLPRVSPGKTVEGALGGLAVSVVVAWAYGKWVLPAAARLAFAPGTALLFGAVVSVAAQVGDLVESLFKREAGVKDSSHIIPGHGGVLDRFDSLLFVLPVAYVMLDHVLLYVPR